MVVKLCRGCGKDISDKRKRQKFCDHDCYILNNRGVNHLNWKGGKHLNDGYLRVTTPDGNRRYEHVLIAENVLNRRLKKGEVVHHINGNKLDNRNENLIICNQSYHKVIHSRMAYRYQQIFLGGE